ncbi:MAG: class I SAM-dependent methyltransferase [Promethearchaeota archaeon]
MKIKNFEKLHSELDLPFLETEERFLKEIFEILEFKFDLKRNSNQKLIDLGSGNGIIIIFSALYYGIKSFGVEINPFLVKESKKRIKSLKKTENFKNKQYKNIKIKLGNFYQQDLKKFDFIYIYSLPSMQKYLNHVFITAKKGAILISHKYKLKNFNSYLKYEKRVAHKKNDQEIFTYFYKKFV